MIIKDIVKRILRILPDKTYLQLRYFLTFRKPLNLKNPKTFNEKLQWLKLYDRKPEYTRMVDKHAVKAYIAETIGGQYVVPTLGVWNSFDEIDFDVLPAKFVLKCTHDSGGLVICKDKESLDKAAAKRILEASLRNNYYWDYREWPYKAVPPRIIAEQLLDAGDGQIPNDYKVLCFQGEAKLIKLHQGRFEDHTLDYYDRDWNRLSGGKVRNKNAEFTAPRPQCLEEMLRLSELLAKDIPHVRVDWYWVDQKLYFGELTFYDGSGLSPFQNVQDDERLGSWIELPR